MLRILLIVSFCLCTVLAAETMKVQPEVDYPIIDINSMYSWEKLRTECPPPTETDPAERCTIKKLGKLGKLDDKSFYFVLYEWLDKNEVGEYGELKRSVKYPHTNTAIALFYSNEISPNMLQPFYADRTELSLGWFEEPRLIRGPQGVLLQIPHRSVKDANAEVDSVLVWQSPGWRSVDTQSWLEDLQARLPEGCSVNREILVNFQLMKASNYLWKASDAACCPTCGRFSAILAVEEDKLVIKELQHNLKARLK